MSWQKVLSSWSSKKNLDSVNKETVGLWTIAAMIALLCVVMVIKPYEPPDDLLRHLISYLHGYDYRKMYIYSSFPSFNMYMGFDWLVGYVHKFLGYYSYIFVQLVNVVFFSAVFVYFLRGTEPNLRAALLLVALYAVLSRLMLGRPSSFVSTLMMLGFALSKDERARWMHHLCVGISIVPLYYLFPIYLIPLFLAHWIYGVVLAGGLLWWHLITDGAYWATTWSVLMSGSVGRVTEIDELKSIAPSLFQLLFAVIPAILFFKKEKKAGLASLWFMLPNQVRYLESAVPLMLSMARHLAFRPTALLVAVLFGIVLSVQVGLSSKATLNKSHLLKNKFKPGDKVYAAAMAMGTQYSNPYILMAPGFEPEWMEPKLRAAYVNTIKTGRFDCSMLDEYSFDYVVESHLQQKPSCLELVDVSGVYRIWKPTGSL